MVIAVITAMASIQFKVYRKWYLSVLEKSFLFNLMILACSLLYIDSHDIVTRQILISTSSTIALLQFVGIVISHVIFRVKKVYDARRLRSNNYVNPGLVSYDDKEIDFYREPLIAYN